MNTVEIENHSRSVYRLPLGDKRVILGDREDRQLEVGTPGCPKVRLTRDEWKELEDVHGKFLAGLVAKGEISIRGATLKASA